MRIRMDNTREPVETGCYLARDCFTCPFRDCMAASGRLRKDRCAPALSGRQGAPHGRRSGRRCATWSAGTPCAPGWRWSSGESAQPMEVIR